MECFDHVSAALTGCVYKCTGRGRSKIADLAHVGSLGPPAAAGLDQKSADIDIHR